MKIQSTSFGEIEVDPESILEFPKGLAGFEDNNQFKLLHSKEFEGLRWIQSLSDKDLAFSIMLPEELGFEYEITLSDEEAEIIGAESTDNLILFVLVYEDRKNADSDNEGVTVTTSGRTMKTSWRSPLILNVENRLGIQKVLDNVSRTTLIRGA